MDATSAHKALSVKADQALRRRLLIVRACRLHAITQGRSAKPLCIRTLRFRLHAGTAGCIFSPVNRRCIPYVGHFGPAVMATIYCDESGFSGNNLLDEQAFFVFATLAMEPDEARAIAEKAIRDFRLQGNELKGSRLLKTPSGHGALSFLIKAVAPRAKIVFHLKKFALASKFFEYIFEPCFSDCNSIYYQINFHRFISMILYVWFVAKSESSEQLFEQFSQMMRDLDPTRMASLSRRELVLVEADDVISMITTFAYLNRRHINKEVTSIRGMEGIQNWVLDLTMTSLYTLLCAWAEQHEVLDVFCDNSKPLKAEVPFLNAMVGRRDRIRFGWPGQEERLVTFNLARPIQLVDSRQHPGVQIADALAATVAWTLREKKSKLSRRWFKELAPCFSEASIIPDESHIDLTQKEPFINAVVLHELVQRSARREDLCRGMPEFIVTANASYNAHPHQRSRSQVGNTGDST